jgi:pimeloyl-ACP methyl ester carboxylesterase
LHEADFHDLFSIGGQLRRAWTWAPAAGHFQGRRRSRRPRPGSPCPESRGEWGPGPTRPHRSPSWPSRPRPPPAPSPRGNDAFPDVVVGELIALVDRTYRALADRDHCAMGGFSMGAGQALEIALAHPELFAWVGRPKAPSTAVARPPGTLEETAIPFEKPPVPLSVPNMGRYQEPAQ